MRRGNSSLKMTVLMDMTTSQKMRVLMDMSSRHDSHSIRLIQISGLLFQTIIWVQVEFGSLFLKTEKQVIGKVSVRDKFWWIFEVVKQKKIIIK